MRIITVVLLVVALICAVAPLTLLGAGWPTWLIAGLLVWALEGASLPPR